MAERYAAIRDFIETRPEALHPVTRADHRRRDALFGGRRVRGPLSRSPNCGARPERIWREIDVLMVPTVPRAAPLERISTAIRSARTRELGTYTNFVNLLDLCALAVPAALRGRTACRPASRLSRRPASDAAHRGARPRACMRKPPCRSARPAGRCRAAAQPSLRPRRR